MAGGPATPREEPWGQTVARLLSIEGLIIGTSYVPLLHTEENQPVA